MAGWRKSSASDFEGCAGEAEAGGAAELFGGFALEADGALEGFDNSLPDGGLIFDADGVFDVM